MCAYSKKVTDAGLAHIEKLSDLKHLDLSGTHITDAGLSRLHALTNLQSLYLGSTYVTDVGLKHLEGLVKLRTLILIGTTVTFEGETRLQDCASGLHYRHTEIRSAGYGVVEGSAGKSIYTGKPTGNRLKKCDSANLPSSESSGRTRKDQKEEKVPPTNGIKIDVTYWQA